MPPKPRNHRNRVAAACTVCRRRKMKCDKAKPACLLCVENETVDFCKYDAKPWEREAEDLNDELRHINTGLQSEIDELRLLLKQKDADMVLLKDYVILQSFANGDVHNQKPRPLASPPNSDYVSPQSHFSIDSVVDGKPQPLVTFPLEFLVLLFNGNNSVVHLGPTLLCLLLMNDGRMSTVYRTMMNRHTVKYDVDPAIAQITTNKPMTFIPFCPVDSHINDAYPHTQSAEELVSSIERVIPARRTFHYLIDRFFTVVYPVIAIVDAVPFKAKVNLLVTHRTRGGVKIVVLDDTDFYWLAMVLYVLRLAYLTLPTDDNSLMDPSAAQQEQLAQMYGVDEEVLRQIRLESTVIGSNYPRLAQRCIRDALPKQLVSLVRIQAMLLSATYSFYLDEYLVSHLQELATLVELARSHALYRDPSEFPLMFTSEPERHLMRKIWHQIRYYDSQMAMAFGTAPLIREDLYNTKLPSVPEGATIGSTNPGVGEYHRDEPYVCYCYQFKNRGTMQINRLLMLCQKVSLAKEPVTVAEFENALNQLDELSETVDTFQHYMYGPFLEFQGELLGNNRYRINGLLFKSDMTLASYLYHFVLYLATRDMENRHPHPAKQTLMLFYIGFRLLEDTLYPEQLRKGMFNTSMTSLIATRVLRGCMRLLQSLCAMLSCEDTSASWYFDYNSIKSWGKDGEAIFEWLSTGDALEEGVVLDVNERFRRRCFVLFHRIFLMARKRSAFYFQCWQICVSLRFMVMVMKYNKYPMYVQRLKMMAERFPALNQSELIKQMMPPEPWISYGRIVDDFMTQIEEYFDLQRLQGSTNPLLLAMPAGGARDPSAEPPLFELDFGMDLDDENVWVDLMEQMFPQSQGVDVVKPTI